MLCSLRTQYELTSVVFLSEGLLELWKIEGEYKQVVSQSASLLRTVPTIVIVHTFCASPDIQISYRWYLLM